MIYFPRFLKAAVSLFSPITNFIRCQGQLLILDRPEKLPFVCSEFHEMQSSKKVSQIFYTFHNQRPQKVFQKNMKEKPFLQQGKKSCQIPLNFCRIGFNAPTKPSQTELLIPQTGRKTRFRLPLES